MKKRSILRAAFWASLSATCVASLSFIPLRPAPQADPSFPFWTDTVPAITEFETGRLDEALNYVDEQIRNAAGEARSIDADRIQRQIGKAMAGIDLDRIQSEVQAAIKKVDFEKLNKDLDKAMASIDKAKVDASIARALAPVQKIDQEKVRNELRTALEGVHLDQLKEQLENAKRDLRFRKKDLDQEMNRLAPGVNDELRNTRKQLQKLKDAYQEMEQDGLIEKGPDNRIQYIEGDLYINGEKQTEEVSKKYRHYFSKETRGVMVRV
ncbi:hypothetical protein [Niabella aurantiaca]|uniref:hypothetical protein n=1 Tax=Niabella aurantiaca TaxID=379900 RepID=UPI000380827C|nr:hypothetical protein [Niabella aurantiaca]